MKNQFKFLSFLLLVVICFGFSSNKVEMNEDDDFFSAQLGVAYFNGTCFTLDRCTGSDLLFYDPNDVFAETNGGSLGWYVISGASSTCGANSRLLSYESSATGCE